MEEEKKLPAGKRRRGGKAAEKMEQQPEAKKVNTKKEELPPPPAAAVVNQNALFMAAAAAAAAVNNATLPPQPRTASVAMARSSRAPPSSANNNNNNGAGPSSSSKPAMNTNKHQPDDWEVLEQDKANVSRLENRVKELQQLAARSNSNTTKSRGGGGAQPPPATQTVYLPIGLGNGSTGAIAINVPTGMIPQQQQQQSREELLSRANEATEALNKLKSVIQGPPSEFPPLFSNPLSAAILAEAATVGEFLALYGEVCEVDKEMTTAELVAAAAWPLEYADDLNALYRQLLLCCLLEQMNRDPPVRSKSRRWFAVLTDYTWPEVLRRYLLFTRVNTTTVADDNDEDKSEEEDEEEEVSGYQEDTGAALVGNRKKSASSGSLELLLSGTSVVPPFEGIDPLDMDEKQLAIHCAASLGSRGWWELPPAAHLGLLGMLCYDIAQGQNLREDINTRVADCTKIQNDLAKEANTARRYRGEGGGSSAKRGKKGNRGAAAAAASGGGGSTKKQKTAANGSEGKDAEDDGIVPSSSAKFEKLQAQLDERAFRTDPLGFDRYCRRYWWLRGAPSHILIESEEGLPTGAITTAGQLNDLIGKLNRRGPREQDLFNNITSKYSEIVDAFAAAGQISIVEAYDIMHVPRPAAFKSEGQKKNAVFQLKNDQAMKALEEAKEQMVAFIDETTEIELSLGCDLNILKNRLQSCSSLVEYCDFLLDMEKYYCTAAEGLPVGGENSELGVLLGEEDVELLPEVVHPPKKDTNGAAAAEVKEDDDIEMAADVAKNIKEEEEKAGNNNNSNSADDEDDDDDDKTATNTNTQPNFITNNYKAPWGANIPPHLVALNDEFDDSDAEHAYLREKRMRRPARLWRSARERAVWLKTVLSARKCALDDSSYAAGPQIDYCTHMLYDRGAKMLKIAAKLAEDILKWEEAEAARAAAEAALAAKEDEKNAAAAPTERPLMIRTQRCKTEDGMRIILRAMGKEPFPPMIKLPGNEPGLPDDSCRWGFTCSVCMLAGDLLCCEHTDGCTVSVHPACAGLINGQVDGAWICSNHEARGARARRKSSLHGGLAAAIDAELTTEDDESDVEEKNSEEEQYSMDDSDQEAMAAARAASKSRRATRRDS